MLCMPWVGVWAGLGLWTVDWTTLGHPCSPTLHSKVSTVCVLSGPAHLGMLHMAPPSWLPLHECPCPYPCLCSFAILPDSAHLGMLRMGHFELSRAMIGEGLKPEPLPSGSASMDSSFVSGDGRVGAEFCAWARAARVPCMAPVPEGWPMCQAMAGWVRCLVSTVFLCD